MQHVYQYGSGLAKALKKSKPATKDAGLCPYDTPSKPACRVALAVTKYPIICTLTRTR